MYGPDEHRGAIRRIGEIARDAERSREPIQYLRDDLRDDAHDETQAARDHLANASRLLGQALAAFDNAVAALPTPVAQDWRRIGKELYGR